MLARAYIGGVPTIDLNADLGEGFGPYRPANDADVLRQVPFDYPASAGAHIFLGAAALIVAVWHKAMLGI